MPSIERTWYSGTWVNVIGSQETTEPGRLSTANRVLSEPSAKNSSALLQLEERADRRAGMICALAGDVRIAVRLLSRAET